MIIVLFHVLYLLGKCIYQNYRVKKQEVTDNSMDENMDHNMDQNMDDNVDNNTGDEVYHVSWVTGEEIQHYFDLFNDSTDEDTDEGKDKDTKDTRSSSGIRKYQYLSRRHTSYRKPAYQRTFEAIHAILTDKKYSDKMLKVYLRFASVLPCQWDCCLDHRFFS